MCLYNLNLVFIEPALSGLSGEYMKEEFLTKIF